MKIRIKLYLMREIEQRNQERIRDYVHKPRKRPSNRFKEKTEDNRAKPKKPK